MAVFKNDIGTKIIVDVGVNSDDINIAKLYVEKPDGNKVMWNASIENGTTNISYTTQDGDLDLTGKYEIQPYLELSSGWKGRGTKFILEVEEVI